MRCLGPILSLLASLATRTFAISGSATFYEVGLGACGNQNSAGDFIVALNQNQFDEGGVGVYPGVHCGQQITITGRGKTVVATIADRCPNPGCNYGDLDMSRGLFSQFASFDDGRFDINWDYGGGGGGGGDQHTPDPTPTQTHTTAESSPSSTGTAHTEGTTAGTAGGNGTYTGNIAAVNQLGLMLGGLVDRAAELTSQATTIQRRGEL